MTKRPGVLLSLLILTSACVYLLGNRSVALWDRDEPRYAQTSRQMLQSGDWVVPHFLDAVRTAKPPLIYWCQATAMKIFGDNAFAARFPSSVAMLITLTILSGIFWKKLGPTQTLWTIFIFATSGLVIAAAKMCITDSVLLLFITVSQLCVYAMWRGDFSWLVITSYAISLGLAGLTKGPVVLGFNLTTLIILGLLNLIDKKWPPNVGRDFITPPDHRGVVKPRPTLVIFKLFAVLAIVVAITAPWLILINHRAHSFIQSAWNHEVKDRLLAPLEQHWGPPGYYILVLFLTFFPWSLFLPMGIGLAIRDRANPMKRFALAAVIGPWIMLECVATKLPFYILPVYPALAFLVGDALLQCLRGTCTDLKSKLFVFIVGIWAILIAVGCSVPWIAVLPYHSALPIKTMILLSILGPVFAITVFAFFKARRLAAGSIAMGIGTFVLVTVFYSLYFPRADFLRISPRIAKILINHNVTQPGQVIMLDYMEPSLAFHQGGTMREAGEVTLSHKSMNELKPWMVVTDTIWRKAPQDVKDQFDIVDQVYGLAYADKARWMTVMVLKRKPEFIK